MGGVCVGGGKGGGGGGAQITLFSNRQAFCPASKTKTIVFGTPVARPKSSHMQKAGPKSRVPASRP